MVLLPVLDWLLLLVWLLPLFWLIGGFAGLLLLFALLVLDLAGRPMYYTPARLPLRSGQRERLGLAVFGGDKRPSPSTAGGMPQYCAPGLFVAHQIEAEVGGTQPIRPVDSSTFRSEG